MPPDFLRKEVETCGPCHARRAEFSEAWVPGRWLSDTHSVATLSQGLYQADGQMLDEVYNYGSFKQSKMFALGVTCSDCHDPHGAKLVLAGDSVCLQCHQAVKYETATHSHHDGITPAIGCPACHMPARIYMVVDTRHDHSFRIPRPDLSVRFGTPNACNDCHRDKPASWAATAVEGWFGPKREGFQTYATAFDAAWNDRPGASALLAAVAGDPQTPAIARASALTELASRLSPANINLARTGLGDRDPAVRIGALDMIKSLPVQQRWTLMAPLLSDPVAGIRIKAVSYLADVPASVLQADERAILEGAADEFVASLQLNADRPESRSALGNFYRQRGLTAEAESEYKAALKLSPLYAPASVNLADLYGGLGHDDQAEQVLRAALILAPADAGLHHALGLTLVRLKRSLEAVTELGRAAELDPAGARYAYVYAVALHSIGDASKAAAVLKESQARHPEDRDTLVALVDFSREAGDAAAAVRYAEQLLQVAPDDPQLRALVDELRRTKP
jgi:predicted CXXCH cytochrome family protein